MPVDLSKLLVVAISSSALFDSRVEHGIFLKKGLEDYVNYQVEHEDEPLPAGTALPLIRALLKLNELPGKDKKPQQLVDVVILSQMEPAAGLRVMNSCHHHGLDITRAAFTGGASVAPYLKTYNVTLFLSTNEVDVREALKGKIAAGLLYDPPKSTTEELQQLRIAFDGDAVIFSDESEKVYKAKGLDAFVEYERKNALRPLPEGPFAPFLKAIAKIQHHVREARAAGIPPITTALVTARGSPSHKRVMLTLRAWGVKIDEMFFMGGVSKDKILHTFRPHIFFDDQDVHAKPASLLVPSARVPWAQELDGQHTLPFAGAIEPRAKAAKKKSSEATIKEKPRRKGRATGKASRGRHTR
jgi:5'-nucleotidase